MNFREKIWKNTKLKSDFPTVLNAVAEAKQKKIDDVLRLPKNNQNSIALQVGATKENSPLAITAGGNTQISTVGIAEDNSTRSLLPSKANFIMKPKWHPPWQLYRVISGHTGWVRAVDVEPNNEWFVTGGSDRIIKVLMKNFFVILF